MKEISNEEKKRKLALIQSIRNIKTSYKTLRKNLTDEQTQLERKYRPITTSIKQLIENNGYKPSKNSSAAARIVPSQTIESDVDSCQENGELVWECDDVAASNFENSTSSRRKRKINVDDNCDLEKKRRKKVVSKKETKTNDVMKGTKKLVIALKRNKNIEKMLQEKLRQKEDDEEKEHDKDNEEQNQIRKTIENKTDQLKTISELQDKIENGSLKKHDELLKKNAEKGKCIKNRRYRARDPPYIPKARQFRSSSMPEELEPQVRQLRGRTISTDARTHILPSIKEADEEEEKLGSGVDIDFVPYSQNTVYSYWDDPNELVDRLRLLISSQSAGHTGHEREIASIIEELRESNFIK